MRELAARDAEARWVDRYELVAEIATGGMATVYLARLSGVGGFQRFVAIKRLHPHLAYEPEFIEMFVEEARLAARIHHPNVVSILEIGTSAESYHIAMEYVEGATLGRLLVHAAETHRRLPIKVGLRIVGDMLAGLDAAHELKDDDGKPLGMVHRDVSPQNVLVGVDGTARLSDFGVARATSKLPTTRAGQLKGKLAYMSPEHAQGSSDIDRRADVFAAGIVLWEVLACRRLFKGDGEIDTLNKVLHLPIPSLRAATPTVPAALEAVVAKALERDREKRFSSAAELGDALERACRVLGALGTSKDVAAHVDAVLGAELKQQREGVRAWLGRSEPPPASRPPASLPPASLPPAAVSPTSVPPSMGNGVPSITSAVISNRPAAATTSAPPTPSTPAASAATRRRGSRGSSWSWMLPLSAAIVGAIGFARWAGTPHVAASLSSQPPALTPAAAPPPDPSPPSPPALSSSLAPSLSLAPTPSLTPAPESSLAPAPSLTLALPSALPLPPAPASASTSADAAPADAPRTQYR